MNKKIVLLPLDERPCNASFPTQLFSHKGVTISCMNDLGNKKSPAEHDKIERFLETECKDADGLVISMDMLLYGGLIPSRLHMLDRETLIERTRVLKRLKAANPSLLIYAFQTIMRCPDYSSNDEEPDYYARYGRQIHDLGEKVHKSRLGIGAANDVSKALALVDQNCLNDYIGRRETNRFMDVETVLMLRDGIIDELVIPQDDSAKYGYSALDQKIVREKIDEYGLSERVLMYPGADEVSLTLISKMLTGFEGKCPRVFVKYLSELSKQIIPLYEGCTLATTVGYHVLSAGCRLTYCYETADVVLFITAPSEKMLESVEQPSDTPEYNSERNFPEMLAWLKSCLADGKIAAIGDNAYANGGEIKLINILNRHDMLMKIGGYAGWNTSANTIGTVIAEAVDAYLFGTTPEHLDFLLERYVEDAGYCSVVRSAVTNILPADMNYFDVRETDGSAAHEVRRQLDEFIAKSLSSIAEKSEITGVSMPWKRMFEVKLGVKYHAGV